ncbi:MAG TPA: DUF4126 domain-containing protein [Burkholderiaceae bacterium]|nr:DUF4126 domain-containing protein [Burkholderiaceae bacterium]
MDSVVQHLPELALAGALAWGAGLRLYLVVAALGLAGHLGWLPLPEHLQPLASPVVIGAAGFMAAVELLADKLPWIDSLWDALQTFIRIPAGAALAAGVFGDSGAGIALAAALLGGSVTAATHFSKAGARAAANTSPEPLSNLGLSLVEDALVIGGGWLAVEQPLLFLVLLATFLVVAALLLHVLVRGFRRLFRRTAAALQALGAP